MISYKAVNNNSKNMSSECVKVMVRARPINQREINEGSKQCIEIDKRLNQVIIRKGPGDEKAFTYDAVYDWNSTQRSVYDESAFPLVESVLEGYNGTIFAYGQTGCGKTHTMMGVKDGDPDHRGIIPNAFEHIFGFIDDCPSNNSTMKFLVRCSYLEIYNEDIRDLLNSKQNLDNKLELKEDPNRGGVYVKDLTCCIVKSIPEIEKLMNFGTSQRKTGETAMNKDSSRSHSIFTIYIETSETDANGESRIKAGKLNLVDLAGSERQSKTQAQGIRLKEATKINLSLSALGNVISALVDGKAQHIPYRDSKLTRLLQDSLGGNTKTVMIAAISPSDFNYEESLSTLRYAARAKSIKNKPRVNEDPKDALLKQYEEEIQKLKRLLEQNSGANMINIQQAQLAVKRQATQDQHIVTAANMEEESVDQLLEKLAKKGKKIKIINEADDTQGTAPDEHVDSPQINPNRKGIKQARSNGQDPYSIEEAIDEEDDTGGGHHPQAQHFHKDSSSLPPTIKRVNTKRTIIRESSDSQLSSGQQAAPKINLKEALNDASLSKDQLQQMIKEMEQRLVVGGNAISGDQNQEEKERLRQQRALQIKLRNERKKQKQLLEEKQKKEEQLLLQQQQYSSLQEEVDQNRKIVEKLRSKYTQIAEELKDVREEAEEHKEGMLDTIREQEREIEFLNLVMRALLKDFELQNLREKSRYDEFNQRWVLPVFYVKDKVIQLPKVGIRNADSLISQELDKRDFIVQGQQEYHNDFDGHGSFGPAQGTSQKSQRTGMNETYYNGNNGGFGAKKTGQGFMRQNLQNPTTSGLGDIMRQSRMSIGPETQSVEGQRATPMEFKRGAHTGPRAGIKVKPGGRIIIDSQQQEYNQFSSLSNHMNNDEIMLSKKNNKSNVLLQPLNYKSNLPQAGVQNVAQGIEEILKNHQISFNSSSQENMPQSFYGQSSIPLKKNKLPPANPGQIQLNLNPSDSTGGMNGQNGSFQMSIQATVSIEPSQFVAAQQRRGPQLAPIQQPGGGQSPPQLKTLALEQASTISQARLNGALNNVNNGGGGQVNRKNRVYLAGVNQQTIE